MKLLNPSYSQYSIGLVLYHPEQSLLKRIQLMEEIGIKVYVFDNSPFVGVYSQVIQKNPNITYLTAGKNVGIGFSLSTLCATAYAHGHRRLLFLDQDTGISVKTLEFIKSYMHNLSIDIDRQYAALVFSGHSALDQSIKEVRLAISSGSLFNLTALKQIGWHNENYFVDCVDYELCLRARRSGFKIGMISNTTDFDHVSEQPDRSINILGKQVLVRRYSFVRIKDSLVSYMKLIIGDIFKNSIIDTVILIKSLSIYIINQFISRLIKKK
jgi:rhamnosyltransferase